MSASILVKSIAVSIGDRLILDDVSFELSEGEIACVLGPSGCGKTTLLRSIAGFQTIQRGEILFGDNSVNRPDYCLPVEQRGIGLVFQDYALFPHLSVADNILFGIVHHAEADAKLRLRELSELLSLEDHLQKYPHQLSGGQQQRVALARAMAPRPSLLLLDEPFASLDVELREQIAYELRQILKQNDVTTVMVSHNQLEAFAIADHVGVMKNGQLLQWDLPFNLYHKPRSEDVGRLIGEGVFIKGRIHDANAVDTEIGLIQCPQPHDFSQGQTVKILLRPDDIQHDADSSSQAILLEKAFRGANYLYTLEVDSGARLLSLVPSHHQHLMNEPIGICLDIDHLVMFAD